MTEPVISTLKEPVIVSPKPGELLPCPFCGSEAGLEHDESYSGGVWRVYCCDNSEDNCPIGYTNTIGYARRVEAAAAWNKRSDGGDKNEIERLRKALVKPSPDDYPPGWVTGETP